MDHERTPAVALPVLAAISLRMFSICCFSTCFEGAGVFALCTGNTLHQQFTHVLSKLTLR